MADDINVKIGGDTRNLDKKTKGLKKEFTSLGRSIVGAFVGIKTLVGGVRLLGSAIKNTISFNKGMAEANTIAKLSKGEFKALKEEVLELGTQFGQTTESLTKGLYQALSAGIPSGDAISFLTQASKAAVAGVTDLETSVDGLTTVINAYGLKASDAEKISDTFFETIRLGKTTFPELSQSIGNVATIANAAGISFEDTAAAIASLTKKGVDTATATTQLRGAIKNLLAPSEDLKKVQRDIARQMGITTIATKPLQEQLRLIANEVDNDSQALKTLFPDIRGLNAVLALTGENATSAAMDLADISDAAGAAGSAFATMADDTSVKLAKMNANWNQLSISLTNKFVPAVNAALEEYNSLLDSVKKRGKVAALQEFFGVVKTGARASTDDDILREEVRLLTKRQGKRDEAARIAKKKNDIIEQEEQRRIQDRNNESIKSEKKAAEKIAKAKAAAKKKAKETVESQEKTFGSTLEAIRRETIIQDLKNRGLEREAALKQKIFETEKKLGRKLTAEESLRLTTAEDIRLEGVREPSAIQNEPEIQSDALRRIGGSLGGETKEGMNLDKQRNKTLAEIAKIMKAEEEAVQEQILI